MATQPVSPSGAAYSKSGLVDLPASRPMGRAGAYQVTGLAAVGPLRPISLAGVRSDVGGFARAGAGRPLLPALAAYAASGIVSLLNLRLLSQALSEYGGSTFLRSGVSRAISPSFAVFVPPPPAPVVDTVPPEVGHFDPAPGTAIARTGSVAFDVTDDSGDFRRIFIVAYFPATGACEVVHDGDGFRGFYAARSSRTMITGGFRYTLLRSGGWPAAPTIQTFAIDRAGNEAS